MSQPPSILSPAELVLALLGYAGVREACSVDRTTAWRWTRPRAQRGTDGTIPRRHHAALLEYASAHGIELTAADLLQGRPADAPEREAA